MTESEINIPTEASTPEWHSAKSVVALFVHALKNSALYPEDHSITQKFFFKVLAGLQKHVSQFGELRIDVTKDALLHQGEQIYKEMSSGDDRFVVSLFSDGITWISFQEGITLEEIIAFFRVLNRYKIPLKEADGDLVTALWDLNLPHLYYDATDVLWETDKLIDLSQINRGSQYAEEEKNENSETPPPSTGISDQLEGNDFTVLTDEEEQALRSMVRAEEDQNTGEDALDILVIILQGQSDEKDFQTVLIFLKEEFEKLLIQGHVSIVLNLLENIRVLMMSCKVEKPWAFPLLEKFLLDISTPDSLVGLHGVLSTLDIQNEERVDQVSRFLSVLEPKAIETIAVFMEEISSPIVQHLLLDGIKHLVEKEPRMMEQFLKTADDSTAIKVMPILSFLPNDMAERLLIKYLHHSSAPLRRAALGVFLRKKESNVSKIFPLLEDTDQGIRELALNLISRERSKVCEQYLTNYLHKGIYKVSGPEHLLSCYKALGGCGSIVSIPFLTKVLQSNGWNSFFGFGKVNHRRGAAEALRLLQLPEADSVLAQAARSRFPVIKKAMQSQGNLR